MRNRLRSLLVILAVSLLFGASHVNAAALTSTPTPQPTASATEKVFYLSQAYGNFGDFYVVNSDGTGLKQLTNHLIFNTANDLIKSAKIDYDQYYMNKGYLLSGLGASKDGRYMAVAWNIYINDSTRGGDNILATKSQLFIIDSQDYQIHSVPVDKIKRFSEFDWSPDSKQLAFVADREGIGQIDVVDMTNNFAIKSLIQDDVDKDDPFWSPDGKSIAYIGDKDNKSQLYVADADGKNAHSLTDDLNIDLIKNAKPDTDPYVKHLPEEKWQPDWSPDGKQLLFVSWQGKEGAVYVVGADGKNARQLVPFGKGAGAAWFDNSTIIYFSDSASQDNFQLHSIKADGTGDRQLTTAGTSLEIVSFSPDKKHMLFTSDSNRIYVVNADGTDQHIIKFGAAFAVYWEPWDK